MVSSGSLPPGLVLFSSGTLAGTPTTEGTFTFTIKATDRNGCTGTRQYTITIDCPTIDVHPSTLPDGTVGHSYNRTITASGGSNPYTFMVSDGSLPPGLTLSSSGTLAGTPTTEGGFTFTIQARDSHGCTGKQEYTVKIDCSEITVKPFSLPKGTVNHPYSRIITASGGNSPYTFTLENGSLPPGLTLSPGGLLSGTPTAVGNFTFTILATDSYGCTGKRQYTVTIDDCPSITVKPFTLPNGTVNHPYSRIITASGGDGPYTFSLLSGSLPPGLTLTSGGTLSGTPTAQGGFTFTIQAKDSFGCTGKRKYTLVIGHN